MWTRSPSCSQDWYTPCLKKKLCQCYFVNYSVKHWPNLIIFGTQHREETRHKWPQFCPPNLNTAATLPCEMQKSYSLDVYNNEFMLGTTCWLRKSLWDQKIVEKYLFIIKQEQVYRTKISGVDELKWCISSESHGYWMCWWRFGFSIYALAFVLEADIYDFEHIL